MKDWDDFARQSVYTRGDGVSEEQKESNDIGVGTMARVVGWTINVDDRLAYDPASAWGSIIGSNSPAVGLSIYLGRPEALGRLWKKKSFLDVR